MVTASYDVSNPGLARFERNASMTLDELRAERFAQMDPRKLALPEYRRQAERIVVNEYHHLQTLKVALALGVFVGVGSLRRTAKTLPPQRAPQVGNVVSSAQKLLPTPQGVPNAGGYIRSFMAEKSEFYYRVYSDRPQGGFLTKVPPKSRTLAREGLSLPPGNEAIYIQKVWVPEGTRLQRSRALPAFDKRGGMEQFYLIDEIPPTNFKEGKLLK